MLPVSRCLAIVALLGAGAGARAEPGAIYTCVDAQGRRITSDRRIVECLDREQKQLNSSGTVRRTVPPTLTASERAAQEEREHRRAEEELRRLEERRVDRLLLARYPNQEVHDAERAKALQTVQDAIDSGNRRIVELHGQRHRLEQQTEFYKSAAKWPPQLRRQMEENQEQLEAQQRFIAAQEEERKRVNTRFDDELARLKVLWAQRTAAAATASGAAPGTAAATASAAAAAAAPRAGAPRPGAAK
jgi:hypothetical protein